jgi:hypothetical protein
MGLGDAEEGAGGERNIDPSPPVGYAGTRHRTPDIDRRVKRGD